MTDDRHTRIPYEPALDGLRGLAVAAVVLYHAELVYRGRAWVSAGFLGVDAFFVISGFLITALLVVEHGQERRVDLARFWTRRARRLLPALFAVVGFVSVYAALLADATQLAAIRADGLASLLYVTNWRFIAQGTDYFTQFEVPSPFQHLWSLAIEEQWYLVWPFVVLVALRGRRGSVRRLLWVAALGTVASAAWMAILFERTGDVGRVYFGTDTRAQSLLLGAVLAAALIRGVTVSERMARLWVPLAGSLALAGLLGAWMLGDESQTWYYRGGFLVHGVAVCLVIVAAVQPDANPVRRLLALRPLRALGVISYGVYLWHRPLFLLLNRDRHLLENWSVEAITALRLVATLLVATASYLLLERPIRTGLLGRRLGPWSGLTIPAAASVLALALVVTTTRPAGPTLRVPAVEASPTAPSEGRLPDQDDLAEGIDPSTRPLPNGAATTDDTKVLVVGDSVAYSMAEGFTPDIQTQNRLLVWNQTVLFCELASGPRLENGLVVEPSDTCDDWDETWRANVQEFSPEVAVLQVGAWEIFNRKVDGDWLVFGTAEFDRYFLGLLGDAIDALASEGATVVVLTSPHFERADTISAREWTQNETWRTDHLNELLDQAVAEHPGAVLLPFGRWLCPDDDCVDELAGGVTVRTDGVHFSDAGAQAAASWLAPQLRAVALVEAQR